MGGSKVTGVQPSMQSAEEQAGDSQPVVPGAQLSPEPTAAHPVLTTLPEPPPLPATAAVFSWNVVLVILLGVAFSGWLLHFTDWFPEFGGLIALGGLFSWLAFVFKILSQDRLEALQQWLDHAVLSKRWMVAVTAIVAVTVAALSVTRGTIRLEAVDETAQRAAWIYMLGSDRGEPTQLAPGQSVKANLRADFRGSQYIVKVSGYPDRVVTLYPWHITDVFVPYSLLQRPVLLLVPEPDLVISAKSPDNAGMELRVTTDGRTITVPFDGHAVWVGCDEDVQVPAAVQDAWRSQLANRSQLLTYWIYPQHLTQERVELRTGQRIDYRVYLRGDPYSPDAAVQVQPVQGRSSFPQQEVIHEPKQ